MSNRTNDDSGKKGVMQYFTKQFDGSFKYSLCTYSNKVSSQAFVISCVFLK